MFYWLAVTPSLSTRLISAATSASYICCQRLLPTLVLDSTLRLVAVLSTAMDSFLEHNSKQASEAEPTIEEIKNWDSDELLEWIQQNRPKLIKGDKLEKFKAEDISGDVFVNHAGDEAFFKNGCNLPRGTSERLANLAREIAGGQKGKEQDTSAGESTDHTPLLFSLH